MKHFGPCRHEERHRGKEASGVRESQGKFQTLQHRTQGERMCCCWCGGLALSCLTFVTPWSVAHQAPLSMRFPRQEYWSGLPFPSPGDLPDPGIEPFSPRLLHWQADSLPLSQLGSPVTSNYSFNIYTLLQCRRPGLDPWARKTPWRRK